jgi:Cys-tRNA(Pro) deacylase
MIDLPPVARALDALHVPYRLFVHAGPVHSLEQAARERNQQPDQVIRSIVFRVGKDEFLMALMAGHRQIAWPALRRYLGQSRLTMATEDEVRRVTGYERGAVAPFGLPQLLRLLADPSVFAPEEISLGSGVRGTAIIMASHDLRRALGSVEILDLAGFHDPD